MKVKRSKRIGWVVGVVIWLAAAFVIYQQVQPKLEAPGSETLFIDG